ncbi:archaetidylserine decarboxylase [Sodalis sp. CWE]|uniref:archaetidylserine decarboxylase n=1 Tax=Sodalis sp. CWE TaxID=2803816 RepID=UPI001C7E1B41|nr:archaetidylserine decarboxylase [Sodalis sp. CWE]MBX4180812.1 phosphatidylserine decarboxylase [Sodalis sp. CWE]
MDKLKIILHQFLPKKWITELIGLGAEYRGGWITKVLISLFVRWYNIDLKEAQKQDISLYSTFNEFFVRPLRYEVRPIDTDPKALICPADGVISQIGFIKDKQIFQAKKHYFNLEALLACNEFMVAKFQNGIFATIYLSPRDCHRIYMPCDGILHEMLYVPGELFSLNSLAVTNIPNVFARNERVICLFDTNFGLMAQILIGAIIVGSIETVWEGVITPPREGVIKRWRYCHADNKKKITLLKGQEMGRFKLGSSVINLFTNNSVVLSEHLHKNYTIHFGQKLGHGIPQNNIHNNV